MNQPGSRRIGSPFELSPVSFQRERSSLSKSWEEALREQDQKPPLLVFRGFRQAAWIDNDRTSILHERKGLSRQWDRYWNSGWRVRFNNTHICNSFFYPTHVLLKNGDIVEIGRQVTKAQAKLLGPLTSFKYYDQPHDRLVPDYNWFLNSEGFKPLDTLEAMYTISAFLTDQEEARKAMDFPNDFHLGRANG